MKLDCLIKLDLFRLSVHCENALKLKYVLKFCTSQEIFAQSEGTTFRTGCVKYGIISTLKIICR